MTDEQIYRNLCTIGKRIFVDYFEEFRNSDRSTCIKLLEEEHPEFTDKSRSSRVGHAQSIFKHGCEKRALEMIINSNRLDDDLKSKCEEYISEME